MTKNNQRLTEANRKIEKIIPDLWAQAENNLKKIEEEYYLRKNDKK